MKLLKYHISILLVIAALAFIAIGTGGTTGTMQVMADSTYSVTDSVKCTYWITKSTGKRHNKTCYRYKKKAKVIALMKKKVLHVEFAAGEYENSFIKLRRFYIGKLPLSISFK